MGESLVESPKVVNKMGDSVAHIPCLQESVSFGRFEQDSLCWERWSTFPTNKYLEEVEKCSTPGSVAQKKAYFEAHYKRIAARKAELLDQELNREGESMNSEDQTSLDLVCTTSEEELDIERSNTENSVDGDRTELFNDVSDLVGVLSDKHIDIPINSADITIEDDEVADFTSEVIEHIDELSDGANIMEEVNEVDTIDVGNEVDLIDEASEHIDVLHDETDVADEKMNVQPIQTEHIDEPNNDADIIEENKDIQPQLEDASEHLSLKIEISEMPDEPVLVKEDTISTRVWQDKEVLSQEKVEEREITERKIKKTVDLVDPGKIKKTTLVKKTTNTANAKKKLASPIPKRPVAPVTKSPAISTPKPSKPDLTKTAKSTTRPLAKKEIGYTPLTSKKGIRPESRRVLPTSLHMSLSFAPANSDPASHTTMRKSSIMESMGDKDIVKRAFKAFQNVNQLSQSSLTKPITTNQSATKRSEPKASTPDNLQKKKEGIVRTAKAESPVTGQRGTKKTLQSPGLKKTIGMDQRNGKSVSASFGSRSLDQGRQQKEVPKKLELKSNIKDAGKTYLQSKLKAEKAAEIGKQSHRVNPKAKLSSSYNQGHGFLRGSVRKEDAKI